MKLLIAFCFLLVIIGFIFFYIRKWYKEIKPQFPVFTRDSNNYHLIAQNNNKICSSNPERILQPRTTKDISYIVTQYDQLSVRSCGNCFEPWSTTDGILIDMSLFDTIMIIYPKESGDDTIAVIEAGVTYDSVYRYLHKIGYTFPGSCDVYRGVVVQSMTDGYGYLTRKYGSLIDNVVAYKIVLADGRDVICSKTENDDLFWALRGYGAGNFGVVTQVFIRLIRIPQDVTVFIYTYSEPEKILEWFTKKNKLSKRITCKLYMTKTSIQLRGVFLGDERKTVERLNSVPKPDKVVVKEMSYDEALEMLKVTKTFDSIKGKSHFGKGKLAKKAINILSSYRKNIYVNCTIELQMLQEGFLLSYYIMFNRQTPVVDWALIQIDALYNKILNYLTPFSSMSVMDKDIVDYLTAYYGSKNMRKKLIEIKQKYDPDNKFSYKQGII